MVWCWTCDAMVDANSMRDASEAGNGVLLCSVQKAR